MPKYLLLKHYRGGPEPHHPFPPMDQWAPEDVEAHMAFLRHVSELLEENGEYVDAQALTPARTWVRYGGPDAAPVTTDGPLPETSDLVAGWYMIDVESHERALELAAYVSSEPGPGGEPLYEWIDVREVMSGAVGGLTGVIDEPTRRLDEGALRALVPRVLAGLVRRGEDFDAAEDALQEALLEALRVWPEHPPRDPRAWLTTVATRRLVDARRSEAARHRREETTYAEPRPAATEEGDDTLFLLFCCCHPDLAPASQVALTLRAVGGLTTREIADAFYVPEATMAQRISRAKRTLRGRRLDQPGDLAVVLRVLYLVYTAGHAGPSGPGRRGDPARPPAHPRHGGARGARAARADAPEPRPAPGAARPRGPDRHARPAGPRPVGHARDRRGRARPAVGARHADEERRPGRYQVEAAIAALHDDAASAEETDWPQILAWYDDLVALTEDPVRQDPAAVLGRAVAVGHVLGAAAGLRETDRLREVIGERHRWHAVRGHLHELAGDLPAAATARTPRPPAGPRTSPSATTWSARPPAREPRRLAVDPLGPAGETMGRAAS